MNLKTRGGVTPPTMCNDEAKPAAREGEVRLSPEERVSVRDALDMLALALTDTGHVWTDGERSAYERAMEIVG